MTAPDASGLDAVLAEVVGRVDYFRAERSAPADDGWLRTSGLIADPPGLATLIRSTGDGRGIADPQVTASLFVQAYAFRVAAVPLAAFVLGRPVPAVGPHDVAIRIARHRPAAVSYLNPEVRTMDASELATELFESHLRKLIAAVRAGIRIGERLCWGNVAASFATALRAIESAAGVERTLVRERAAGFWAVAEPWIGGLGAWHLIGEADPPGWFWARSSCCLWYRASGGMLCDDCSLLDPDERDANWRQHMAEATP